MRIMGLWLMKVINNVLWRLNIWCGVCLLWGLVLLLIIVFGVVEYMKYLIVFIRLVVLGVLLRLIVLEMMYFFDCLCMFFLWISVVLIFWMRLLLLVRIFFIVLLM